MNYMERKGLYRSRDGMLLGVVRGVAEHYDLSAFWLRLFIFILVVSTGIGPGLLVYLLFGMIMKVEPIQGVVGPSDKQQPDVREEKLKSRFTDLERRIRKMEDVVTSKDFDWKDRLNGKSR